MTSAGNVLAARASSVRCTMNNTASWMSGSRSSKTPTVPAKGPQPKEAPKPEDTGSELERRAAALEPFAFNADNVDPVQVDNRSDNKGPEPEGVAVGQVGRTTYAFLGAERQGGVYAYDLSSRKGEARFAGYVNTRPGDLGPEGLAPLTEAALPQRSLPMPARRHLLDEADRVDDRGQDLVHNLDDRVDHRRQDFLESTHSAGSPIGVPPRGLRQAQGASRGTFYASGLKIPHLD